MVDIEDRAKATEGTTSVEAEDPPAPSHCAHTATSGDAIAPDTELFSVLGNAGQTPGRRERILDLLCRFRIPASGKALPFFAKNLLASLRCAISDRTIEEAKLRPILDDLEWLATSNEVAASCRTPKLRDGNPAFGYCATTAPHYAAICQTVPSDQDRPPNLKRTQDFATIQAQLFLLMRETPLPPEQVSAYEKHIQLGEALPLIGEPACAAFRGIRFLAISDSEGTEILDQMPRGLSPSEFVAKLLEIKVPESPEAIRRFSELHDHLEFLLENAPRLRKTRDSRGALGSKRPSGSCGHGQKGTGDSRHRVRARRLQPRVEPKIARACAETDASPDELTADDQLIVGDSDDPNDDPVRIELLTRAQLRSMHKPVETMPWNVRGLSDGELTPLLQAAARAASDPTAGTTDDTRCLTVYCLLITMLFASCTFEEACDSMVYGPRTLAPQADLAIYFADDPAEDKLRLVAIKPEYANQEPEPADKVHHPSGFVWLPLPSLLSFLLRAASSVRDTSLDLRGPCKLCTHVSEMREQALEILADLDPSGRVSLSRLRSTLPARIWQRTEGDLTLTSFLSGRKHGLINAELHYDGADLRSLATLYREVTES